MSQQHSDEIVVVSAFGRIVRLSCGHMYVVSEKDHPIMLKVGEAYRCPTCSRREPKTAQFRAL